MNPERVRGRRIDLAYSVTGKKPVSRSYEFKRSHTRIGRVTGASPGATRRRGIPPGVRWIMYVPLH